MSLSNVDIVFNYTLQTHRPTVVYGHFMAMTDTLDILHYIIQPSHGGGGLSILKSVAMSSEFQLAQSKALSTSQHISKPKLVAILCTWENTLFAVTFPDRTTSSSNLHHTRQMQKLRLACSNQLPNRPYSRHGHDEQREMLGRQICASERKSWHNIIVTSRSCDVISLFRYLLYDALFKKTRLGRQAFTAWIRSITPRTCPSVQSGQRNFFHTIVQGSGRFQLSDLVAWVMG